MNNDVQRILSELVAFKTVSGNVAEISRCFAYIKDELKDLPFKIETVSSNGVESVLWQSPSENTSRVLLNAHIDVVPAADELFTMKDEKGKLIGRGVSDMKFAVACFIVAVKTSFAENGQLPAADILLTSDEEVGGMNGVGYVVKTKKLQYDVVVIPDAGDDWQIAEEAKGVLHLKLSTVGRSAHASRPWEGSNAADLLLQDLTKLRQQYPETRHEEWKTTLNIGQLHSGTQTNQVPDSAFATIDIRYVSSDSKAEIVEKVKTLCANSQVETLVEADPHFVDRSNENIQRWVTLMNEQGLEANFIKETGASDGRYFSSLGLPVLLSKPLGGAIHTDHEWLDGAALTNYLKLLQQYLAKWK